MSDAHQQLREKVAAEYDIALYRSYTEQQATLKLKREISWFKRHRKAGDIPYVKHVGGGIAYLGYMLVDIIILGAKAIEWADIPDASSKSATGGSSSATEAPSTTPPGTTQPSVGQSAYLSARASLNAPKKS